MIAPLADSHRFLLRRTRWVAILLALAGAAIPAPAFAQSSFTTEVTEAGKVDLSFDFLGSVARRRAGGFEWYLPAVTFGVTDRLEVGAAISLLVPRTTDEPREFISHARWRWLETDSHRAAVIGGDWHLPVTKRSGGDAYGMIAATFSQAFGGEQTATLSAGLYALVGRTGTSDTRQGVTLSWDHALSPRWSYAVEWASGNNWYGYFSPGITFTSGAHWITAGYCVGNRPAANHGPCISAGRTF